MRFLNIAFDLDNTLVNFGKAFNLSALSEFGLHDKIPNVYDYTISHGMTDEQRMVCLKDVYEHYGMLSVYDGVRDLMKLLWVGTGDPITIISARPTSSAVNTHKLVMERICKSVPYTLVLTENSVEKIPYLRRFHYYVDDNIDMAWMLATQTDTKVFLVDQPYNRGLIHENIAPITGIKELLEMDINLFWEEK
jgi:hypothetical protein